MSTNERCAVCGRHATKRIRPMMMLFCTQCAKRIIRGVKKKGLAVVKMPDDMSKAEKTATDLMLYDVDIIVLWIARTKFEYERGAQLNMIAGWDSWEHYEHHFREVVSLVETVKPVINLATTPDEIVQQLEARGLPNTPQARSKLYGLLAMPQVEVLRKQMAGD